MVATRIHTVGGSGSGTSTLGRALAAALSYRWLDADDFFWEPTEPPYTTQRAKPDRISMLTEETVGERWVLSGSVAGWDAAIENRFDAVIFLFVPPRIRMQRLRERELARFGGTLDTGFMEWAEKYDSAGMEMRSLAVHEQWLSERSCPVLRIEGSPTLEDSLQRALGFVRGVPGRA